MKLESKFSIGNEIYHVENNRIRRGQITDVEYRSGNFEYGIRDIWPSGKLGRIRFVKEADLFATSQECAEFLLKNVVMTPAIEVA